MKQEALVSERSVGDDSEPFLNRELSWLEFNARVLGEARSPSTPALDRVKFLSIFASNLDEFFMVRVAAKKKLVAEGLQATDSPDSLSGKEVLKRIRLRTRELVLEHYATLLHDVLPELARNHIHLTQYAKLDTAEQKTLTEYFMNSVFPVLTPLAVDPAHPFPFLANRALYLLICFEKGSKSADTPPIAFVAVPSVLPRLIPVTGAGGEHRFIFLEDLIAEHLQQLFMGFAVQGIAPVRVTRDLDYTLLENEVVDLLKSVQNEVRQCEQSEAVRLEISDGAPQFIVDFLRAKLQLEEDDVYTIPGPLALNGLMSLVDLPLEHLKEPQFNPRIPQQLKGTKNIFSLLSEQDLLLHHPYDSFYAVIEFLNSAAYDPDVLAVKQTLYRTSGDSPIIDALISAAENGKEVTAVVELKARFDEKNNIIWARRMERAGVNVVFGFIGLKTHAKTTLVVRKEGDQIKRYVHLSTGNYNSATAKMYVDLGYLTARRDIGHDISTFFNLLTGFNILTADQEHLADLIPNFRKIALAPLNLRSTILNLIDREIANQKASGRSLIAAKLNALVDKTIIEKLYEASQAGVPIKLIVRGICCLRPGVPGLSETIQVISVVDRFLEHSRIYHFHAGGADEVYLGSADWMPRNMDRRVEILFPIDDERVKKRLVDETLRTYWLDNVKAKALQADGTYAPVLRDENASAIRAQERFIELAREQGLKSLPYEKAIRHGHKPTGERPIWQQEKGPGEKANKGKRKI